MGNLTKPVIGMIGLLSKAMFYWLPDGKQSKLINNGLRACMALDFRFILSGSS